MAQGTVGVRLKKDWFGPDGSLYYVRDNPHEFPAAYADKSKQADDESDEDFKARQKRQPYAVLPSSAELVEGGGKTVAVLQQTASGDVIVPTLVDADVKSVGGALDNKGIEQPDQSTAAAVKGAEEQNLQVGGKPADSGPLPAGSKK